MLIKNSIIFLSTPSALSLFKNKPLTSTPDIKFQEQQNTFLKIKTIRKQNQRKLAYQTKQDQEWLNLPPAKSTRWQAILREDMIQANVKRVLNKATKEM